jgi:hypothetical protein
MAYFSNGTEGMMPVLTNLLDEYSTAGLHGKAGLEACKAIAIAKGEL